MPAAYATEFSFLSQYWKEWKEKKGMKALMAIVKRHSPGGLLHLLSLYPSLHLHTFLPFLHTP